MIPTLEKVINLVTICRIFRAWRERKLPRMLTAHSYSGSTPLGCVVCGLLIVFLMGGCVQRRLHIRSHPEGALVSVDKQAVGHTPVSVPFTYYGTREIQLEKDGFKTTRVDQNIKPPWWQIPPFDLITDNFWPRELRDERLLDFQLEPRTNTMENQLIDRANQLRGNVQRDTVPMPLNHGS